MIAIIKYNAGNIKSVENALQRLDKQCIVTDDVAEIRAASHVIFPGVGEARTAMRYLKERGLDKLIKDLKQPVLGICLGQQLMCQHSEENDTDCLGIFDCMVKKFPPKEKVPHIGWNDFLELKGTLFKGISRQDDVYFVHSYYAEICEETTAICDYILPFSAGLQKDNFYATQFHPEKSASIGEKILRNFLAIS
jgi:glutamine amidotransferase